MPVVFTFNGGKGGVGTTSLAAEAAAILAAERLAVAAIDLDYYNGDLDFRFDAPARSGTLDLGDLMPLIGELDRRLVDRVLVDCACGVRLLRSPRGVCNGGPLTGPTVETLIASVSDRFDCVVVDTAPGPSECTQSALSAADVPVLVSTPEVSCLGAIRRIADSLASSPDRGAPPLLILNRSLGGADLVSLREIESFLGKKPDLVIREENRVFRRFADEGRLLSRARTPVTRELYAMGALLLRHTTTRSHAPRKPVPQTGS